MKYHPDDIVKSCRRLESGLRFGPDGIRACTLGAFQAPLYWSADEASQIKITKEMVIKKRKWLFDLLNDEQSDVDINCKHCQMVITKRYGDVNFTRLGQIDHAATSVCNLRCKFCGFTARDFFIEKKYDDLAILREFTAEDVEWDSVVDFNGGEPTLLPNVDEYLEYFASRRIRVRFMTNGVQFHQSVYDGLANGSIQWVCTSVDAGTPSTYLRIKKRDHYMKVMENLTRYAHAGSQGGGMLAIKYIFCGDNCGDDDIAGFTYAVLAIRPHQVWLTFDFSPFWELHADTDDFGKYDWSNDIKAYAMMYVLLKKHGITPVHYTTGHLALVSKQGKILLNRVLNEIEAITPPSYPPELKLKDFRREEDVLQVKTASFMTGPLRIVEPWREIQQWSLRSKRIFLTPACQMSIDILSDYDIQQSKILGFLDRDRVVQGKSINGHKIHGYDAIERLNPDYILVVSLEQHRDDIVRKLAKYTNVNKHVVVYDDILKLPKSYMHTEKKPVLSV